MAEKAATQASSGMVLTIILKYVASLLFSSSFDPVNILLITVQVSREEFLNGEFLECDTCDEDE